VEIEVGHPYDVEHATRLHVEWCVALIERTGLTTTNQTEAQMRAVMLELRQSLEPAAVLRIANALPALERGIFLDGWSLDYTPDPPIDPDQFYDRVFEKVKNHHTPPRSIAADVFWLWSHKLPRRQADTIRQSLPSTLAALWPADVQT
jgi:uncharacterized protein (DUF2267 family)